MSTEADSFQAQDGQETDSVGDAVQDDILNALNEAGGGADEVNEPELEEIEIDGKTYALPKELKDKFMMRADYSRKTSELAAQRKSLESKALVQLEREQLAKATHELDLQEHQLRQKLAHYDNVNWDALAQQNPQRAQMEFFNFQRAKGELGDLSDTRAKLIDMFENRTEQHIIEVKTHAIREVKRLLPEYSEQLGYEVGQFAKNSLGWNEHLLNLADISPEIFMSLYGSYKLAKMQSTNPNAQQQAGARVIKGRAVTATRDMDKLSTEEWMKRRNKAAGA